METGTYIRPILAIWRVSSRLLYSTPPTYYSDEDCRRLSSTFSQFFVDKLKRISDTIAVNLTYSTTAVAGQFQFCDRRRRSQITRKDAGQIVALDIVPTSLLKACADQFADIIAVIISRLANFTRESSQCVSRLPRYCHYWRSLVQIRAIRRTSGRYQTFPRSLKCWRD